MRLVNVLQLLDEHVGVLVNPVDELLPHSEQGLADVLLPVLDNVDVGVVLLYLKRGHALDFFKVLHFLLKAVVDVDQVLLLNQTGVALVQI